MTSTSPEHRATVDHLRLIKAAWAEILPELPEHLTRHQLDRYWYRTYIAAVRTGAPNPAAIAAEVLATPTPPRTPEHDPGTQPPRTTEDSTTDPRICT